MRSQRTQQAGAGFQMLSNWLLRFGSSALW